MLTLSSQEVDKIAQNFCVDEMFERNMICRSLTENFPESCSSLHQCPLFLFKLHLMEKAKEKE